MVYPPFCDICSLCFTSEQYNKSYNCAKNFFELLKNAVSNEYNDVKINVLGPIQPRISKISNKYRNIITIKCKNNKRFREMLSVLIKEYMKNNQINGANITVDINPLV